MRRIKRLESRSARLVAFAGALVIAIGLSLGLSPIWSFRLAGGFIYAMVMISLNILTGYAGQVSFGHSALMGTGAFTGALLASRGAPPLLALASAGLCTAAFAALLGLPAVRIRGLQLAVVTLGYAVLAENFLFRHISRGGAGLAVPRGRLLGLDLRSDRVFALLCLALLVLVYFGDIRLLRTRAGRAFLAVRDDEMVASAAGIDVARYKLMAFSLSGLIAGLAGGLFAYRVESVSAASFPFQLSITFALLAVVGGLGSRPGVVFVSFVFLFVPEVITPLERVFPLVYAIVALVNLGRMPGGVGSLIPGSKTPLARGIRDARS